MNIEQLEYIVEISKTNSVSIASENLHVSQSAISQSISRIENELGVKIFNRSRMGSFPTDKGSKIIEKAFEILQKVEELKLEAKSQQVDLQGELKISIIPNMMMLLFNTLSSFKKDHPHVNVELIEKGSGEVLEDLKENKVDLGLLTINDELLKASDYLFFEKLVDGELKIFVGKEHSLSNRETITAKELIHYPLVLFKSKYIKKVVSDLSNMYGNLNILFTTDSNDVIKRATMDCIGIGIGTSHTTKFDPHVINGDIVTLDIADYQPIEEIYFGLVKNKGQALSAAAQKFIHLLKIQLKK